MKPRLQRVASRAKRSLVLLAGRAALFLAWTVVLGALGLFVLEESGILVEIVRSRLAGRLGPLSDGLSIERVSLRWFEPGVVIEGVSLKTPVLTRTPGGVPRVAEKELLHVRALRASLSLPFDPRRPLSRLEIDGGRVLVSDELLGALDRLTSPESGGGPSFGPDLEPPPVRLSDFEIELELPDGTALDLGRADVFARPSGGKSFELRGRMIPTLAGAVTKPTPVHFEGHKTGTHVEIHASARDLPLETERFRVPGSFGALPVEELTARVTLDARAELDLDEAGARPRGSLRLSVRDARLLPRAGDPPLEDLRLELDSRFEPGTDGGLWDRDSWASTASLEARWNGSPTRAYGLIGRSAPRGALARLWMRSERLALSERTLVALGQMERFRETWNALEPGGSVDASLDLVVAPPLVASDEPLFREPEIVLHLRHVGASSMVYHGWHDELGQRRGFPLPCNAIRGNAVYARRADLRRPERLGLIGMEAQHGSGTIFGSGLLCALPAGVERDGYEGPQLDLVVDVPSIAIDQRLRAALGANPATADVWSTYTPEGGTLSAHWRLRGAPAARGTTALGEVRVRGTRIVWKDLPIPFEDTSGELRFRWGARAARVVDGPPSTYRPFGIAYRFRNDDGEGTRPNVTARVEGFVREDVPAGDALRLGDVPLDTVNGLAVEIDDLKLRGRDWDVIAREYPEVGAQVEELGAVGGMGVRFYGATAVPGAPYRSTVEATPNVVEVTPSFFRRRTQNLVGRVIASLETVEGREDEERFELLLNVAGEWAQGVELAARGRIPSGATAVVTAFGAGIDATNTAFKGALLRAFDESERGVGDGFDMSSGSLHGRLDVGALFEWETDREEDPTRQSYRLYLRDNELRTESIVLDELHGVLEQRDDVLRSPRIEAALAGHPLVLENVLVLRLEEVARVPEADPLLLRPGFWTDGQGFALQAELSLVDLPLDAEHLESVVDPGTLAALRGSAVWKGKIDLGRTRIVITSEADDEGRVALHGDVRPHDLVTRLGLPIEVDSARMNIRELVLEAGRIRGWSEIEELSARIGGRELDGGRMIATYCDGRLTIDRLVGDFEGGRLVSLGGEEQGGTALAIDLRDPYGFDVRVQLESVEVGSLLQGVFASSIADQGRIDLAVQLRGEPGEVLGISGSGAFALSEGKLWSIPVMRALFGQLGFDKTGLFDRMEARFQVREGRIHTPEVKVRSNLLNLVGEGWLDLDGGLSYDFEVRYSLLDRLGPFNKLLYWLNNSLWRVAVRGDMQRPEVILRNSILEFLRGFRERRSRALPLPDFAPLGPRF